MNETQTAALEAQKREEASPVLGEPSPESVPVEHESQKDAQEVAQPSFQEAPEGDL